jgi:hypothetical protein
MAKKDTRLKLQLEVEAFIRELQRADISAEAKHNIQRIARFPCQGQLDLARDVLKRELAGD